MKAPHKILLLVIWALAGLVRAEPFQVLTSNTYLDGEAVSYYPGAWVFVHLWHKEAEGPEPSLTVSSTRPCLAAADANIFTAGTALQSLACDLSSGQAGFWLRLSGEKTVSLSLRQAGQSPQVLRLDYPYFQAERPDPVAAADALQRSLLRQGLRRPLTYRLQKIENSNTWGEKGILRVTSEDEIYYRGQKENRPSVFADREPSGGTHKGKLVDAAALQERKEAFLKTWMKAGCLLPIGKVSGKLLLLVQSMRAGQRDLDGKPYTVPAIFSLYELGPSPQCPLETVGIRADREYNHRLGFSAQLTQNLRVQDYGDFDLVLESKAHLLDSRLGYEPATRDRLDFYQVIEDVKNEIP